jgi:hypothetical protein
MSGAIAYAMSDYAPGLDGAQGAVKLPSDRGGCGQMHLVQVDGEGRPYVECEQCGPALIAGHASFAGTPGGVPLTPDELGERELAERDAKATERVILRSVTDHLVGEITAKKEKPPTLLEQIAALSSAEKVQLSELLASDTAGAVADNRETKEPAKRTQGRPRTTH